MSVFKRKPWQFPTENLLTFFQCPPASLTLLFCVLFSQPLSVDIDIVQSAYDHLAVCEYVKIIMALMAWTAISHRVFSLQADTGRLLLRVTLIWHTLPLSKTAICTARHKMCAVYLNCDYCFLSFPFRNQHKISKPKKVLEFSWL